MGLKMVVDKAVKSMEKVGVSRFRLRGVAEDAIVRELSGVVEKYKDRYNVYVDEGSMSNDSPFVEYEVIIGKIERSGE